MTGKCSWGVVIGMAIVSTIAFSGCEKRKSLTWRQEAQLQDGRVVVVERVSKQRSGSIPENIVIEYMQEIAFINPNSDERITWELPTGLGIWMLDFDGDSTYSVFKPKSVADYNNWDCPNPSWIVYRHRSGSWDRLILDELPVRFQRPNMLAAANSNEKISADGVVTVSEFETYLKRLDSEYRVISREKISPIGKGCDEDVLVRLGRQAEIDRRR